MNKWVLGIVGLLGAACSSGEEPATGDSDQAPGTGASDGTGATTGESTGGTGAGTSSGGTVGSGGTMEMMATGGTAMGIEGTPFVFVGSTEGTLRAYRMSESDGSLTAAGSHDLNALGFFTVRPTSPDGATQTVFVASSDGVAAVEYDASSETFTPVHTAAASGTGTHITSTPTGTSVLAAHYNENALSVFGYSPDSGFTSEQASAPGTNAHQVRLRGTSVYVPCLGSNHVALYNLDGASVTAASPPTVSAEGGPRHMDFHPSEPVAYVLAELSSEIHVYDIAADGALTQRAGASVSTYADDEYHWSSDIKVTPDGKFVYAVNRDPSEIVLFTVGADQTLTRGAAVSLVGEVRSFGMDPKGAFLQVGSKDGIVQSFSIDPATGALTAGPSLSGLGSINNTEIHYIDAE